MSRRPHPDARRPFQQSQALCRLSTPGWLVQNETPRMPYFRPRPCTLSAACCLGAPLLCICSTPLPSALAVRPATPAGAGLRPHDRDGSPEPEATVACLMFGSATGIQLVSPTSAAMRPCTVTPETFVVPEAMADILENTKPRRHGETSADNLCE